MQPAEAMRPELVAFSRSATAWLGTFAGSGALHRLQCYFFLSALVGVVVVVELLEFGNERACCDRSKTRGLYPGSEILQLPKGSLARTVASA